jgi:hypothetical protein
MQLALLAQMIDPTPQITENHGKPRLKGNGQAASELLPCAPPVYRRAY